MRPFFWRRRQKETLASLSQSKKRLEVSQCGIVVALRKKGCHRIIHKKKELASLYSPQKILEVSQCGISFCFQKKGLSSYFIHKKRTRFASPQKVLEVSQCGIVFAFIKKGLSSCLLYTQKKRFRLFRLTSDFCVILLENVVCTVRGGDRRLLLRVYDTCCTEKKTRGIYIYMQTECQALDYAFFQVLLFR